MILYLFYFFCCFFPLSKTIAFFTAWTYPTTHIQYKSHLAKNFIIYCRPEFTPLGGAVIEESAFWLITPIHFVAHSKTLYPCVQWIVLNLGHAHLRQPFFFRYVAKCWKPTFSSSSQAISPICTKLGTQHLRTLLTKSYQNFLQIWFKTGSIGYLQRGHV